MEFYEDGDYIVSADDPLRDAAAQSGLYRHHASQTPLHPRGHHQGAGLRHPQPDRAEAKHPPEGAAASVLKCQQAIAAITIRW